MKRAKKMNAASIARSVSQLSLMLALGISLAPLRGFSESEKVASEAPSGGGIFDMSLEDALAMEVSTASKFSGRADLAPGNISVVTQEDIRRYGYRTIGDALQRVPGFIQNDWGEFSALGFRGLTPQDFSSNARILVLIDGVPFNDKFSNSAFLNEQFPLDIESIDRIEVLKGAGSAIWGSNALLAVVNIISKDASSSRNKQVMGEYGSHERKKGYASWGGRTEGGLRGFASISATDQDGSISSYYPANDTGYPNDGITDGPYDRKAYRTTAKFAYEDFYANVLYTRDTVRTTSNVNFIFDSGGTIEDRPTTTRMEVGYKVDLWTEQEGELLVRGYGTSDLYQSAITLPNAAVPGNNYTSLVRSTQRSRGAEVRYSQNIVEDLKALIGFEVTRSNQLKFSAFSDERQGDGGQVPGSEFRYDLTYFRTDRSMYFDLVYSPFSKLNIFVGGRYDKPASDSYYTSKISGAFGPRVSVVAQPAEETITKLLYAQGFRNQTILEDSPQAVDPERTDTYELVVEQRFGKVANVSASLFYTDLTDSIGYAYSEDGQQYYRNFKGFESTGVELEGKARLDETLQGYLSFVYAEGRSKDTYTNIRNIPSYMGRAGVSWSFGDYVVASPELMVYGSTRSDNGYRYAQYLVSNLTLLSHPVATGANLSASIYNIFDKDYARYTSGSGDGANAFENGREYRIQATWQF